MGRTQRTVPCALSFYPTIGFVYDVVGIARPYIEDWYLNRKRARYVNSEIARQVEYYPDSDEFCILNWYRTYKRKKFLSKNVITNYVEHNCTEEFKG